ncbi:MAG: TonB-dependent receptor plug domain-containing protein, partial [Acidobacteriota bacterium]|nr:TonB-dependent receptor plug domain-containing protein [Acidobacteriota bacterium]
MKDKCFGFKFILLNGVVAAALLLCACVSMLTAQTVATLDEVVITASRAEENRREISSNVTVISNEQIQSSTAVSLDQLMQQNGFHIVSQGTQKTMYIRGMGQSGMNTEMQSRVLVLVNGRRIG